MVDFDWLYTLYSAIDWNIVYRIVTTKCLHCTKCLPFLSKKLPKWHILLFKSSYQKHVTCQIFQCNKTALNKLILSFFFQKHSMEYASPCVFFKLSSILTDLIVMVMYIMHKKLLEILLFGKYIKQYNKIN